MSVCAVDSRPRVSAESMHKYANSAAILVGRVDTAHSAGSTLIVTSAVRHRHNYLRVERACTVPRRARALFARSAPTDRPTVARCVNRQFDRPDLSLPSHTRPRRAKAR